MSEEYKIPEPLRNPREILLIKTLTSKYKNLLDPFLVKRTANIENRQAVERIPSNVIDTIDELSKSMTHKELSQTIIKLGAEGYPNLSKIASKFDVTTEEVYQSINYRDSKIHSFNEICMTRSYKIDYTIARDKWRQATASYLHKNQAEFFGYAGLLFRSVLSYFFLFRAIQSIALTYGYDTKKDDLEMMIASRVFFTAIGLNFNIPKDPLMNNIEDLMVMKKSVTFKELLKLQGFDQRIKKEIIDSLFNEIMENSQEQKEKLIEKYGNDILEKSIFLELLKIITKQSQKSSERQFSFVNVGIATYFDEFLMKRATKIAKIFYHKRFILEKEIRSKAFMELQWDVIN